jgi:hypothetical protein
MALNLLQPKQEGLTTSIWLNYGHKRVDLSINPYSDKLSVLLIGDNDVQLCISTTKFVADIGNAE